MRRAFLVGGVCVLFAVGVLSGCGLGGGDGRADDEPGRAGSRIKIGKVAITINDEGATVVCTPGDGGRSVSCRFELPTTGGGYVTDVATIPLPGVGVSMASAVTGVETVDGREVLVVCSKVGIGRSCSRITIYPVGTWLRVKGARAEKPTPTLARVIATVREWHDDEGWGVVRADGIPGDIWVPFSAIQTEGYKKLDPGGRVEVEVEGPLPFEQDGFRYRALTVRPLD